MLKEKPYYSLTEYYQSLFGEKVYKIALDANLTCPNRDGTLDTRGCIFCSSGGSGDFTFASSLSIYDQIEKGKYFISKKAKGSKYIAYFQAFTNTYGNINYLKKIYYEALNHPDIVGIAIATRPDCLNDSILSLIGEINHVKKVWIELGLQTIHEKTAKWMRRGYDLKCFDHAVEHLNAYNIDIVIHLILGLPNESKSDLLKTINYITSKPIQGIKLQLLHVLEGTDLATLYKQKQLETLTLEQYADLVVTCIEHIPPHIVIHRITGDGPKHLLLAPTWSSNKKVALNTIHKLFRDKNTYQGKRSC